MGNQPIKCVLSSKLPPWVTRASALWETAAVSEEHYVSRTIVHRAQRRWNFLILSLFSHWLEGAKSGVGVNFSRNYDLLCTGTIQRDREEINRNRGY